MTAKAAVAEQLVELRLSDDPALAKRVFRLLPARLARDVADDVLAHRELARLTPARPRSSFHVGPAAAAARLRSYYTEAERRSGISWQLLAAVNYVESDFGRLREASVAGAQGPMQFMPSTWASYGRGDVHDPRARPGQGSCAGPARPTAEPGGSPLSSARSPRGLVTP